MGRRTDKAEISLMDFGLLNIKVVFVSELFVVNHVWVVVKLHVVDGRAVEAHGGVVFGVDPSDSILIS